MSYFKHLVYPSIVVGSIAAVSLLIISIVFSEQLIDLRGCISLIVLDCWYLKSLFAVFFIIFLCGFIPNKWVRIAVLCLVFFVHAFCIKDLWYVSYSMPFILFGNHLRYVYEKIVDRKWFFYILLLATSLMTIFWNPEYLFYFAPYNLSAAGIFHNAYRIIYAISICLLILLSFKKIVCFLPTKVLDMLSSVGRNTLIIYLLQFFIIEKILCYASFSTGSMVADNALFAPLLSMALIILFHKLGLYLADKPIVSKLLYLQK